MGDTLSQPVESAPMNATDSASGAVNAEGSGAANGAESSPGDGAEPASPGGGANSGGGAPHSDLGTQDLAGVGTPSRATIPTECEILGRLVCTLGKCTNQTMSLAEIREKLPPSLQRVAADTDRIRVWLRTYQLFEISGQPGEEKVTLKVGKFPPAPASAVRSATPTSCDAVAGANTSSSSTELFTGPPAASNPTHGAAELKSDSNKNSATKAAFPSVPENGNEEENSNPCSVQLRGLPFRATIADIRNFLGDHCANLANVDPPIRLLLNRDGRPSGFARIQFNTPQATQACRDALHKQQMGDRYVEVLACSERGCKSRRHRATDLDTGATVDAATDLRERERVLEECRLHMRRPDRSPLLSMLGIALSEPSRDYLKRLNMGLKQFLGRLPEEFSIDGPKGREEVHIIDSAFVVAVPAEPATPQPTKSPGMLGIGPHSAGHGISTPSDWGTPGPNLGNGNGNENSGLAGADNVSVPASFASRTAPLKEDMTPSVLDGTVLNPFWPGSMAFAWGDPHLAAVAWTQQEAAAALALTSAAVRSATGATATPAKASTSGDLHQTKSKRGGRGEAASTRSHAHLHPQSHPFANKPSDDGLTGVYVAPTDGEGGAVVRLRGLPFTATEQDVYVFFAQHDVADLIAEGPKAADLLLKANGRPSGQAIVKMKSRADAEKAQRSLSMKNIGGRYIEVFVYGELGEVGAVVGQSPSESDGAMPSVGVPGLRCDTPARLPPWISGFPRPPQPQIPMGVSGIGEVASEGWSWPGASHLLGMSGGVGQFGFGELNPAMAHLAAGGGALLSGFTKPPAAPAVPAGATGRPTLQV